MIALGIETATERLSVALSRPGVPVIERYLDGARRHAAALLPMVVAVLEEGATSLEAVEVLAIADGPGSFTGLRVAAAAAKSLARVRHGMALWTAPSLMIRAAGVTALPGAKVLVVTSALRGELYAACYRPDLPSRIETLAPPGIVTPESLGGQSPDLLIADADDKLVERLAARFEVPLVRGTAGLPSAAALLRLVGAAGGAAPVVNIDDWEPRYGRPAEAQVKWEATHGRTLPDPTRQPG